MDSLIPSYLSIGGVVFPLLARDNGLLMVAGRGGDRDDFLGAVQVAVDQMVRGDHKDAPIEQLARNGFREQGLWAEPIDPSQSVDYLLDGLINWRRLSGTWPDPASSFMVHADFMRRNLVIPREVLFELVRNLRELDADLASGRRLGRVDDAPVPPLPPLTPAMETYEALRAESAAEAEEYRKELYARRG